MNHATDLDRIRAWVEGALPDEDARALERRLEEDPELAAVAREYRAAHELTAALVEPPERSRLSFGDLNLEDCPPQLATAFTSSWAHWRRAAAAIFLVALGSALGYRLHTPSGAASVRLAQITLIEPAPRTPALASPLPAQLESYAPVQDGAIRWLERPEEARQLARATGRPVLIFGAMPGCESCECMRRDCFRAESVVELAAETVPLQIDVSALSPEEIEQLGMEGTPYLALECCESCEAFEFSGTHSSEELLDLMRGGVERLCARQSECLEWQEVRELATLLERAQVDEEAGRLDAAVERYAELERRGGGRTFTALGEEGRRRIAARARDALFEARGLCPRDLAAAEAVLEQARGTLEGTPYEGDLDAVLGKVRECHRFPALEDAQGGSIQP